MHLLLDPSFQTLYGVVEVDRGRIDSVMLTPEGEATIGERIATWRQQGIETLRTSRSIQNQETMIQFAHESIEFSSANAFAVFQNEAAHHGFIVCTLNAERARHWKEIEAWPMTNRSRGSLLFMLKHMSDQDLPLWKKLWGQMMVKAGA